MQGIQDMCFNILLPDCLIALSPIAPMPLIQVTLVDQSDRFVFKPLLYELLNGAATESEVAPSYLQLLQPYPLVRYLQVGTKVCVFIAVFIDPLAR
jgi:hypothetical protein